ncbi:hypothetical protein EBR66_07380 [bacterium]|nr:hypothetical protein [bacterium]
MLKNVVIYILYMEITAPIAKGYTIYSKSGCTYCTKVKYLLNIAGHEPTVVHCDEYLIEDRAMFNARMTEMAGKECRTFPMVFLDGNYVGGFSETVTLLKE